MRCLLAVDSGGTKCQTIAVKEDGSLVGWGRGGFPDSTDCAHVHHGSGRSAESVNSAIMQALRGVECSELHVVGYHRWALDAVLGSGFQGEVVHHPVPEHDGILQLVGLEFGLIASAGTGAFVHVVAQDGSHLHLDSLGPILGDHGSAYHIGMLAVQAAAKCDWHPRHETSLKEVVHEALSLTADRGRGTSLIGVFDRVKDRAAIADLARLVDEEARGSEHHERPEHPELVEGRSGRGDAVANAILDEAASSLAQTVYDAYDSLQMSGLDYCLVGTGGVIESSDIYWGHLCEHVREFAPDLRFARTDLPHVVGTALSALHNIANGDLDGARERLISSAREVFRSNKEFPK